MVFHASLVSISTRAYGFFPDAHSDCTRLTTWCVNSTNWWSAIRGNCPVSPSPNSCANSRWVGGGLLTCLRKRRRRSVSTQGDFLVRPTELSRQPDKAVRAIHSPIAGVDGRILGQGDAIAGPASLPRSRERQASTERLLPGCCHLLVHWPRVPYSGQRPSKPLS
jgi:hypothetical protein